MTHGDGTTTAVLAAYVRCNLPLAAAEWAEWYDEVHLPDLLDGPDAPRVATRWELTQQPVPGMPSIGFSHVTLYEFDGTDPLPVIDRFVARDTALRADGRIHPNHAVVNTDVLVAHGRWNAKPAPSGDLRGHILAYVLCTDPRRETEWDAWYDADHIPDMMASDAFTAATRWRRADRKGVGAEHVTLYDVGLDDIDTAVERSAAVMPGIVAAGRKHPCHCGAMTVTLAASGRYGGAGLRPGRLS